MSNTYLENVVPLHIRCQSGLVVSALNEIINLIRVTFLLIIPIIIGWIHKWIHTSSNEETFSTMKSSQKDLFQCSNMLVSTTCHENEKISIKLCLHNPTTFVYMVLVQFIWTILLKIYLNVCNWIESVSDTNKRIGRNKQKSTVQCSNYIRTWTTNLLVKAPLKE